MLQILQRDEEALCALLSKHMGCGVTEGMSHMERDAEPGLWSLCLTSWDEHNLPCHLIQPVCVALSRSCCSHPKAAATFWLLVTPAKAEPWASWQTRHGQQVINMLLLMC